MSKQSADFYIAKVTDAFFDYMLIWLKNAPCMPPDEFAAKAIIKIAHPDYRKQLMEKIVTTPLIYEEDFEGYKPFDNL